MILFKQIVLFLLIKLSTQEWNTNDFFRREHSLSKPYGGSSAVIPYWNYIGNTVVSNKFIRMTADVQSQKGAIWNMVPVQFTDWEMQVQFKISGHGRDLFGDGLAIWYAKEPNVLGDVFGYKNYFHGLAIFLDTYSNHNGQHNHQHPYISAMVNNGTLHYDHDRDGTHTQLAGCEAQLRNKDHDIFVAIRYHNYKLTVSTDLDNKNAWKECFSVDKIRLPTRYFFGMSAATGDLSDNHDIISVKVYQLESSRKDENFDHSLIEPVAETFEPPREHVDDPTTSSWGFFKVFGIVLLVIVVVIGGGIAVYWFIQRQSHNKKRFY